jgi:hypothetical protein
MSDILVEESDLSVRAYNRLKRARTTCRECIEDGDGASSCTCESRIPSLALAMQNLVGQDRTLWALVRQKICLHEILLGGS